ncbi:MAG: Gfo/Idh/MocA family oxidoreductase [Leptospirales bacterium]|jgi:predicted dehydrogenase
MKTCLIGLGRIAAGLEGDPLRAKPCTHAGALAHSLKPTHGRGRAPGFELIGVCDRHADKIDDFLEWWGKHPLPGDQASPHSKAEASPKKSSRRAKQETNVAPIARATDYRKLLRAVRPEFVIIATRTDSHFAIARDAMRSGARGLLLEKPISMNLNDARKLERIARETNTRVWVNFERRYHPAYRLVKRYVDEERLGPLRSIQGQVLTWPLRAGANTASANIAGPLLHDAIHWLDLLIWYAGEPRKITARMLESPAAPGVEDTAFLDLEYAGFQARLESGGRRNYFEFTIQLDFEHGRIRSGNEGHFWFRSRPSKRYRNFRDLQAFTPKIPRENENAWLALYDEIRREMAGDGPITFDRIGDAVAGMQIVAACAKRLRKN